MSAADAYTAQLARLAAADPDRRLLVAVLATYHADLFADVLAEVEHHAARQARQAREGAPL